MTRRPRRTRPEAEVEGRPTIVLHDGEREAIVDAVADVLIAALVDGERTSAARVSSIAATSAVEEGGG
jgi:hypothetical protein